MTEYTNYSIFMAPTAPRKPLFWMGSSFEDLLALPRQVRRNIGIALRTAQAGLRHPDAKAMKGFGGNTVMEIVADHEGNTFRAVYSLSFKGAVYALHVFQKKSNKGIKTPKREIELIRRRFRTAVEHYSNWSKSHA